MQPPASIQADIANLSRLLERQIALYDSLQSLAERQHRLITSGETTPLLKLLAERKRLTAELTQLGQQMAPIRERWPQTLERLDTTQRACVERLIAQVNGRLEKLIVTDAEDARRLAMQKDSVGRELGKLHSKRAAVSAYRSPETVASCLDRVHEES